MPEWLVEQGIGEDRAIRLDGSIISHAILDWHNDLRVGQVAEAKLVSRRAGSPRGVARFANGKEAVVDQLPASASEGAMIRLEVTRAALIEERRSKPAQARPTAKPLAPGFGLAENLQKRGEHVKIVRSFPECDWDDLLEEAMDRRVAFTGGALYFSLTPAMTLIDVDSDFPPARGALAAVKPIARSLKRFALGGSIGIDFPTLSSKAERKAIDEALDEALADWPHERTAMNGFGFVQIVARLERQSIPHLLSFREGRADLYRLLRQAEQLEGAGVIELRGDSAMFDVCLDPELIVTLRQRTGREVRIVGDDSLESGRPHAQLVPL